MIEISCLSLDYISNDDYLLALQLLPYSIIVMYHIRPIQAGDNARVAEIIRTVMPEFGCVGEGYSIEDPEVDQMYQAFQAAGRAFYVVAHDSSGEIFGCGGYAPLAGNEHPDTCELQKMYFFPELRGHGLGRQLLERCMDAARRDGYAKMYLETVCRMEAAGKLYRKMGFTIIPAQLGATGHSGCDTFMMRSLLTAE